MKIYHPVVISNQIIRQFQNYIIVKFDEKICLKPGQFLMVYHPLHSLPVALSVIQINDNFLGLLIKRVGYGSDLLCDSQKNDVLRVMMPLGLEAKITERDNIVLIGGGAGVITIFDLAKKLIAENKKITIILAFKLASDICLENLFKDNFSNVFITCDEKTQDADFHGNALQFIDSKKMMFNFIYVCGSAGFLKAVDTKYANKVPGILFMESHMGCGFGICNACVIKNKNGYIQKCCQNTSYKIGDIVYE